MRVRVCVRVCVRVHYTHHTHKHSMHSPINTSTPGKQEIAARNRPKKQSDDRAP